MVLQLLQLQKLIRTCAGILDDKTPISHSLQKCAVYAHTKIYKNWSFNINSTDDS